MPYVRNHQPWHYEDHSLSTPGRWHIFVLISVVMENTCLWFLNEVMEGSLIVGNCQKLWFYMEKPFRVGRCEWGRAQTIFEMTADRCPSMVFYWKTDYGATRIFAYTHWKRQRCTCNRKRAVNRQTKRQTKSLATILYRYIFL